MKRTRRHPAFPILLAAAATLLLVAACARPGALQHLGPHPDRLPRGVLFAHALGAIGPYTYTNSMDAFTTNLNRGARYFEVDLSFTADGKLVCYHPAAILRKRTGLLRPISEVSTAEFLRHRCDGRFTLMTFATLLKAVDSHPGVYIVTDTKSAFRPSLEKVVQIAGQIDPRLVHRIIPQFYQPGQWREVARLESRYGAFRTVIFTLYRTHLDDDGVVAVVRKRRIPVVAMPRRRFNPSFLRRLRAAGADVMVHTINGREAIESYLKQGVRGVYTDHIIDLDQGDKPGARPNGP
ncbi:MAG: hypothetical protein GXP48_01705 [Acidobacteria bacterium]|nr:hypothetical protein [Acidobacteriota bacterium]